MINVQTKIKPELDPAYIPAVLWNRAFRNAVKESGQAVPTVFALKRPNGTVSVFKTEIFPHSGEYKALNIK